MAIEIKTDNRWKPFVYRYDVPKAVLKDQFDYLDEEDGGIDGFFKYKNTWYHTSDFMRASGMGELKGWDGYHGDSYFSGVVIKLSKDGERYKVGLYMSQSWSVST